MDRRTAILMKVQDYKKLQPLFVNFWKDSMKALPPGNDFGIEFGIGDNASCEFKILHYKCRMRFDVRSDISPMLGKITFERTLQEDKTRHLWTIFFDRLGNAKETLNANFWDYTLDELQISNWIGVRLLEEFFKDLVASEAASKVDT